MAFLIDILTATLQLKLMLLTFIGTFVGIVAAAIPGFTIVMAVVLVFPFTFAMDPLEGLSTLMGVYVGGYSGGQIAGILLGIPGTPSSICTVFDGYPMAQKGRPGEALGIGIFASFFGGLMGAVVLITFIRPISTLGLKFGPWEMFSLVLFSLTLIASLGGKSFFKGLFGGTLGLFLATIGMDPLTGKQRFTFGFDALDGGVSLMPVLIGLFAFTHLMKAVSAGKDGAYDSAARTRFTPESLKIPYAAVFGHLKRNWLNTIRSGLIGSFVGALPGEGGTVANFLSYDQAKRYSKNRDFFGTGCPDGIIASEAGNNGTAGGTLIPTLTLGVPGSAVAAVMLGVLMVHNIPPGPGLFRNEPILVYGLFVTFVIAHFFMLFIQLAIGSRFFLRIAITPTHILVPLVLILCAIGSLALNNQVFDIWVFFVCGILGYFIDKAGYPLAPIVIGLILGPIAESNLRQAISTDPNWLLFFTRPISLFFVVFTLLSSVFALIQTQRGKKGLKALFKSKTD